jgi:hypothetical protein
VAGAVSTVPCEQESASTHEPALTPELYCPVGQAEQTRFAVLVPALATYCPGWQSVHVAQLVLLICAENVPEGQPVQTALLVELPGVLTKVPALQFRQGWQDRTLGSALKVPSGQTAHRRSIFVPPARVAYEPARHCVWAAQAVAGSAS